MIVVDQESVHQSVCSYNAHLIWIIFILAITTNDDEICEQIVPWLNYFNVEMFFHRFVIMGYYSYIIVDNIERLREKSPVHYLCVLQMGMLAGCSCCNFRERFKLNIIRLFPCAWKSPLGCSTRNLNVKSYNIYTVMTMNNPKEYQ